MDNATWKPVKRGDKFIVLAELSRIQSHEADLVATIESSDINEAKKRAALCAGSKNMYSVLRAIKARIQGEWDNPHLMALGPLMANTNDDILRFVEQAIKEVKSNIK